MTNTGFFDIEFRLRELEAGDDATKFQINDRPSFMRFLRLGLGDKVPDAKTIWDFRDELVRRNLVKSLFEDFDAYLRAPKQRNSREENQIIKDGGKPEIWGENKQRQKDTTARGWEKIWVMTISHGRAWRRLRST
jgi:transposase, IS5 family